MGNRAKAMAVIKQRLSMFTGYDESVKEVESMLNDLTDKEFDAYMHKLRSGEETLPYIKPNLSKVKMSLKKNLEIAEKVGHTFFERLWLTDTDTGETYLTPIKYLVLRLPIRRQQQHLHKKVSIPATNTAVDDLTGQVTGPSASSRLSYPEMQVMYSQNLRHSIAELFTFRGGNVEMNNALERDAKSGDFPSMEDVFDPNSRVRSTEVLNVMFKAQHLNFNA